MNKENNVKDPRYYYLRITNLKINKQSKFKSEKVQLKLHLGTKYSQTVFELADLEDHLKRQKITGEAHIFKYGGEEFLNIYLEEAFDHAANQKKQQEAALQDQKSIKKEAKEVFSGYCRILLPPLIQHPHICHEIIAKFIAVKNKIEFTDKILAQISFQLYYRLDFKAHINIIPVAGNLQRNVAQFGQMKPIIQLSLQGKTWTSLQAEGIHPRWSGHFHAKKEKIPGNKGHHHIRNMKDNALLNTHSLQERKLYLSQNLTTKQNYFDLASFPLSSAGSFLCVKIFSYPLIGKTPDLVGQAQIRISNAGFFKHPRMFEQHQFFEKEIKLYTMEEDQKLNVGNLNVLVRFVFDKDYVLDCGPYLQEMPRPRVEQEVELTKKKQKLMNQEIKL